MPSKKIRNLMLAVLGVGLLIGGGVFCLFFTFISALVFEGKSREENSEAWAHVETMRRGARVISVSRPPYDLLLDFSAPTGTVQSATIELNRLAVEYPNELAKELVGPSQKMSWTYHRRVQPVWEGDGLVHHEDLFVQGRVTNCITKNASFTVRAEMEFVTGTGDRRVVTNIWDFRPGERLSGIIPNIELEISESMPPGLPRP